MITSKVSVIIPVYNTEKYIKRCLNSIFAQTYSDIEIVCIDDGSKDKSLSLLKSYQKNHPNLKVFHQENKGAASARNLGIEKSTGEYVAFVDSDDAIKKDYIERLVDAVKEGMYDVALVGYKRCRDDGTVFYQCVPPQSKWAMYKLNWSCGKIYRRSLLQQHRIRFSPKYKIGEDMFFAMLILSHTNKVKSIKYIGYINYLNQNSITHSLNTTKENRNTKMLALLKDIEQATRSSNKIPTNYRLFFYLKSTVLHLMTQRHILDNTKYYQEYETYFTWLKEVYKKYNRKLELYFQDGEEFKVNLICNLFILATKIHMTKPLLAVLNKLHIAEIQ